MEIVIPKLLPWQQSAIDRATQRNLVCAGRQSGKSSLVLEILYECIVKQQRIALLFPTGKSMWVHWTRIVNTFFPAITDKNLTRMSMEFSGGAVLECFSAEAVDNMRGNQFDVVVIDEAAHIDKLKDAVESVILPTLLARAGSLWMLSTPKGTTGYFNECLHSGFWAVTQATSYQNTFLDPSEIDKIKASMAPEKVQQELYGIPVDESALTPFFHAYAPEHFDTGIQRNPRYTIFFSFDFNVSIMSCVVSQQTNERKLEVLALIQLKNSSVEAMCSKLLELYPSDLRSGNYKIVGDASGQNKSGYYSGNISFYGLIKQKLRAKDYNMRVATHNMGHPQSQTLCNVVLNLGLVTIASPELNRQVKNLCIDDSGIVKDGNDHGTDCLRYTLHHVYHEVLTKPQKYLVQKKIVQLPGLGVGKYSRAF
jgi:hypothetical protein